MTTDTFEKNFDISFKLDGKNVTIGGCCKGAGMINPNMATMLSFITTDINISKEILDYALKKAVEKSFNSITVDGDMSTNDTVFLLANSMAGNKIIKTKNSKSLKKFIQKLTVVCINLAKMIILDGEGATKFLTIKILNAGNYSKGKEIAESIANSNLVKTAFFGCDLNWGRIISSIGSVKFKIKPKKVKLYINNNLIFSNNTEVSYNKKN